ncbi:cupin domain-containing protein [Streptomyces sp. WMMC500]|uniref:cupin domain-containing protein n=1 Tax=Streptomyces sp. WMMC500 TaxID=3015154 RepID=UPI00248D239C|nr:cupin domain-containing protein [Streptomyces sp. WMMC500]WBB62465.1 cupin domain-containing protein [Streptomyces sp. WMMC500]
MAHNDSAHDHGTDGHAAAASWMEAAKLLAHSDPVAVPEGASAMTVLIEWEPGDPGTPPHRHSGPAFGYVLEGAVRFELEGEPERVVEAGGTFWEPGGDVIHYQDGNALADQRTRFVVVMMCAPGKPMLELVDEEELAQRAHRRAPRPAAGR